MPADDTPRYDANSSSSLDGSSLGTSPSTSNSSRLRTDSESSDKEVRFLLSSSDGAPPKVLTMDEISNVFKNIQNMALVHEIALNPEFKLEPYKPPKNSLHGRVKDMMYKAFWDNLRDQLSQTPPCYDYAIQLLSDIKDCFPHLFSQKNSRSLVRINEVLDDALIRQQAENGVLDFKSYADFVITMMAGACAPARDEMVRKLRDIDDVVDTFKGILDTMDVLKLDMANYMLDYARNDILANGVKYEKNKFKEYLAIYTSGFPQAEQWLKRNYEQMLVEQSDCTNPVEQTMSNAYLEITEWNPNNEIPEMLSIDKERIIKLTQGTLRVLMCGSLIATCQAVPIISQRQDYRASLAPQFNILLEELTDDSQLPNTLESIWLHTKKVINEILVKEDKPPMDEDTEELLKGQILNLAKSDAPVRVIMKQRIRNYMRQVIRMKTGLPPPPSGYELCTMELVSVAAAFKRFVAYNNSVYGEYLREMVKKIHAPDEASPGTSDGAIEPVLNF